MTIHTSTRTPHRTTEERKSQAEALHASIAIQVDALRSTDRWRNFLRFATSFHTYSVNNVLLILAQRPDATAVAGYRAWQAKGRQVRTGEHGIHIFGYRLQTVTTEEDCDITDEPDTGRTITRYPILTVFDISQTDPSDDAPDPTTLTEQLSGTDDFGIIETLSEHLTAQDWSISRHPLAGSLNGYTDPARRQVILSADLSREHAAKTLIHETAHILLGHTDNLADYAHHRGLAETEAESVAYVVAGLTGFDTSSYSIGYIASWANADSTLITSTATRVLNTVHTIANILELDPALSCGAPTPRRTWAAQPTPHRPFATRASVGSPGYPTFFQGPLASPGAWFLVHHLAV